LEDRQWVEGLVEWLIQGVDGPPFDPSAIAEVLGLELWRDRLPWPARSACLAQPRSSKLLLLHSGGHAEDGRWLLAHEVVEAQLVIWGQGHEGLEALADWGADALLMPRSCLRCRRDLTVRELSEVFSVPPWMVQRRLEALAKLDSL